MQLPRRLQSPILFSAVVLVVLGLPISIAVLGTPRSRTGDISWRASFSHPGSLHAGENFPLEAFFSNDLATDVHLTGIDLGPSLAGELEIVSSTPGWSSCTILPDGSWHADFDLSLADGDKLELRLEARAARAGTFKGPILARFDAEHCSASAELEFEVQP